MRPYSPFFTILAIAGLLLTARADEPEKPNDIKVVQGHPSQAVNLTEWNLGGPTLSAVKKDDSYGPDHLADSAATNDSVYYSTTQSKLVYKDGAGVANPLY